jgi:hypothetical protein
MESDPSRLPSRVDLDSGINRAARPAHARRNFEPPGLPMATFMAALCINIALGFAVHGLYSKR